MIDPEFLAISIKGVRHERALLHGAGSVCETRAHAQLWLKRCQRRGRVCIVHLNYTNEGSDQIDAAATDIIIHEAGPSPDVTKQR